MQDDLNKLKESPQIAPGDLPPLPTENLNQTNKQDSLNEEVEMYTEAEELEKPPRKSPKRKRRRKRINLINCNCQSCSCFGCLLLLIVVILFFFVVYFRPPFVLNPVKRYLNKGYEPPKYETQSVREINDKIEFELNEKGEASVSEKELQSLLNDQLASTEYAIDVEPSSFRIVRNISDEINPLYIIVEVSHQSDGNLQITKIGTERIGAPAVLRDMLTNAAFDILDITATQGDSEAVLFVNSLIDQENEDSIGTIRFDKDRVTFELK